MLERGFAVCVGWSWVSFTVGLFGRLFGGSFEVSKQGSICFFPNENTPNNPSYSDFVMYCYNCDVDVQLYDTFVWGPSQWGGPVCPCRTEFGFGRHDQYDKWWQRNSGYVDWCNFRFFQLAIARKPCWRRRRRGSTF